MVYTGYLKAVWPDFLGLMGGVWGARRADFTGYLKAVRPKSGPEGRFTARKQYCVT